MKTKVFGREPAVWLGIIGAVLNLGVAFFLPLTQVQVALINAALAAVVGLVIAVYTKDVSLAIGLGAIQAVIALATGFGLTLSAEQQGSIMAIAGTLFALFNRTQTSPDPDPGLGDGPV